MVTRVVIVTGGTRHEVRVSALGYPNTGLDDAGRHRAAPAPGRHAGAPVPTSTIT